jgi:hypothetical protein
MKPPTRHFFDDALAISCVAFTEVHMAAYSIRRSLGTLGIAIALVMTSQTMSATADVVYTYTGNTYSAFVEDVGVKVSGSYDDTMRVTGTITLANALAPNLPLQDITASLLDYSFNDGRNTLNKANSISMFQIETDATGAILHWDIELEHVEAVPQLLPVLLETITALWGSGVKEDRDLALTFLCPTAEGSGKCRLDGGGGDEAEASPHGSFSAAVVVTPLPAALPLFATGLGALGLLGWRRKKKAAALTA